MTRHADARAGAQVDVWAPGFSSRGGGIAAFSRELALALSTSGSRVGLWAKDDPDGCVEGLPCRGSARVPRRLRTPAFASRLLVGAACGRPAAVVTTHPNLAPAAALARHLLSIPYAVVAHGIDVYPEIPGARLAALRGADAVWAASRWTRQRCLDLGVAPETVHVLGNTVDEHRFLPAPRDPGLARRYGIAPDDKVVLTVARLDPAEQYKGYDQVVRALPHLGRREGTVRYLIAGRGEDRARIERLAHECGVAAQVTFCGFVDDRALADHYRLADAFAMPSRGEGFGIVFLEAMACGVPVLGGNRDGTVDALADGELGMLVDPGDVAAVAAGLERLLDQDGPAQWFDPLRLRAACLGRHGRTAFAQRAATLAASLSRGGG